MRPALRSLLVVAILGVLGAGSIVAARALDGVAGEPVALTRLAPGTPPPSGGDPAAPGSIAPPTAPPDPVRAGAPEPGDYADDRVIVRFKRTADQGDRADTLDEVDADQVARYGQTTVAELTGSTEVEEAVEELTGDPDVAKATPDYLRELDACADCWHLGSGPGANIGSVHDAGRTGSGKVVAILDTGVDTSLPDLAGQVIGQRVCGDKDCVEGSGAGANGTMVASVIAARDDATGATGVAPSARVRSWKVDTGGSSPSIRSSYVLAALNDLLDENDVDIVNTSFSGEAPVPGEAELIAELAKRGKTFVASSGNDGSYVPRYPAAYPDVISVGATDRSGAVAPWSSFGKVDVVAPGSCIPVAAPPGVAGDTGCPGTPAAGTIRATGTSFASPLVAGILALRDTPSSLRNRLALLGTATGIDGLTPDEAKRRGHGSVDAGALNASFAGDAPPYLVVEPGNQLPHPSTDVKAYVLTSDGGLATVPGAVRWSGAVSGTTLPLLVEGGVYAAGAGTGSLSPGSSVVTAAADVLDAGLSREADTAPATTAPTTTEPPTTAPTTTEAPTTTAAATTTTGAEVQAAATPGPTTTTLGDKPLAATPDQAAATAEPEATTGADREPAAAASATTTSGTTAAGRSPSLVQAGLTRATGSVALRILRPDDQAPGIPLMADGTTPWKRSDTVTGSGRGAAGDLDVDDVYSIALGAGDTVRTVLKAPVGEAVRLSLYSPGTTDVYGQWDRIVTTGGAATADGSVTLSYTVPAAGTYLLDVYALGLESRTPAAGAYTLTTTTTGDGLVDVAAPACSPNNDGYGELCRWKLDGGAGGSALVLNKAGVVLETMKGVGEGTWDGTNAAGAAQPDGTYLLRANGIVKGRTLMAEEVLTLDRADPVVSGLGASSGSVFEPVPRDGDRDTITFGVNANEKVLLRVYVYDAGGKTLRKTVQSDFQPAGRVTAEWDGVGGNGDQLPRGSYEYIAHIIDPAGNRVGSGRLPLRIV